MRHCFLVPVERGVFVPIVMAPRPMHIFKQKLFDARDGLSKMSCKSDESGEEIILTQTNFSQIKNDCDSDTILDGLLDLLDDKS